VIDAAIVVALANVQAPRRSAGARAAMARDPLADAVSASALLEPFLNQPIAEPDLGVARAVQQAVLAIVDALIDKADPPLQPLNALAAREPVIQALQPGANGTLHATSQPEHQSATASLLLAVMVELSELAPPRLRRCARPECGLVFYDTSRSATQRWHADRPCGMRERQRRYRRNHPA
jgi:predicted RNA-binding Zn ribbon-like protein